jgi:hypothetical protein
MYSILRPQTVHVEVVRYDRFSRKKSPMTPPLKMDTPVNMIRIPYTSAPIILQYDSHNSGTHTLQLHP